MIRILLGTLIACGSAKPTPAPPQNTKPESESVKDKDKPEKPMKGAKVRQLCIDNPLAKACQGALPPPCDHPPCNAPAESDEDPCGGGE